MENWRKKKKKSFKTGVRNGMEQEAKTWEGEGREGERECEGKRGRRRGPVVLPWDVCHHTSADFFFFFFFFDCSLNSIPSSSTSFDCGGFESSLRSEFNTVWDRMRERWEMKQKRPLRNIHLCFASAAPQSSALEFRTDSVSPFLWAAGYRRAEPTMFLPFFYSLQSQLCWLDICYDHVREGGRQMILDRPILLGIELLIVFVCQTGGWEY